MRRFYCTLLITALPAEANLNEINNLQIVQYMQYLRSHFIQNWLNIFI